MKKYILEVISNKKLAIVFTIALIIRVYGANHGFPHIFNMDETSFVRSVTGLRFSLNPNRFDWPNGYFYFHFIFFTAFYYLRSVVQLLGLRSFIENIFPLLWQDPTVFYFISRVLNAFMGALTVFPLYYSAKKLLKNSTLALFSSIVLTFLPYHVLDSHIAVIDTGLTFWCAVCLYFIISLIDKPSLKNYIFGGFFLGIAFGTKYNAIFYFLPLFIAILYSQKFKLKLESIITLFSIANLKKYLLLIGSFIFAFILTNPFVLVDSALFWSDKYGRGFLFQFKNVGSKQLYEIPQEVIKLFYTQPIKDFGAGVYFIIIIGFILYLFFNFRNKITNLTLLTPLFMFTYMTTKDRNPSHYFEFLYPLLSIFVVYFIYLLVNLISSYIKLSKKVLFVSMFLFIIIFSVKDSLYISYKYGAPDTRQLAYAWLKNNLAEDTLVYYYGSDLERISFKNIAEEKIKRVDITNVDSSKLPFNLLIGVYGLNYSDVMEGERDTRKIEGNEGRFLRKSDLLYYKIPQNQWGPSVFIFKINEIERTR